MLTRILNSLMLKPILAIILVAFVNLPLSATIMPRSLKTLPNETTSIELRAGTPISVELIQNLNSTDLTAGQTVDFRVKFDVIVKKKRVITAGSIGKGQITKVSKRKMFGKPGVLEIQAQYVQAVDGQLVPLTGMALKVRGDDKSALAWGLSVGLGIFTLVGFGTGLFIKGKKAEMPAGTALNVSVASNIEIELDEKP